MSGGHFEHNQYRIGDIVDTILDDIKVNNERDEYGYCNNFSEETLEEFQKAVAVLKLAEVFAQRIDWLMSGDDGEESFHKRLKEEIEGLKNEN